MFLEIVKPGTEEVLMGGYQIDFDQLQDMAYHPYIASTKWDHVTVEVTDETPRNIIRQIILNVPLKAKITSENISVKQLQILCEICPDETAALRVAHSKGADDLNTLLKELVERYGWEWSRVH